MSDYGLITPVNRHIEVSSVTSQPQTKAGVLLPEDFTKKSEKYKKVKVLSVAQDCKESIKACLGMEVIVEKSMLIQLDLPYGKSSLVLENYVIGILQNEN